MSKLYLVRHTETDLNVQERYQGWIDIELNPHGLAQAHQLALQLKTYPINILISSPFKRCLKTAAIITHHLRGISIQEMSEFRERSVGVFEGLTRKEAQTKFPDLWAQKITRQYLSAPPGGETIQEVERRVFAGLKKIQSTHAHLNVLLVTHAFVAKVVHKYFNPVSDQEFFDFKLNHCDIVEYELRLTH